MAGRTAVAAGLALLMLLPMGGALPLAAQEGTDVAGPQDHPGSWELVPGAPLGAIHSALLPNGRVLMWAYGTGYVFDPASRTFAGPVDSATNLFCSGMAMLADGRLLATGGHRGYDQGTGFLGLKSAERFDAAKGRWAQVADMTWKRWYPTAITLSDGKVAVFSGVDAGTIAPETEVFDPLRETWEVKGSFVLNLYVRGHLMPNGKVLFASPAPRAVWWDPASGAFDAEPYHWEVGGHYGGGSLLLDSARGVVLTFGGNGDPRGADKYTLGAGWSSAASLNVPRPEWPDSVLLPNGDALAIGGEPGGTVFPLEYYDAGDDRWLVGATPRFVRPYHSTALLLPDGSVAEMGPSRTLEIYRPWYFFAGPRPSISAAPPVAAYGAPIPIVTPDAGSVARVVLMRLGSVTHSLNTDQRLVDLAFAAVPGVGLAALAPAHGNLAPPGYYMLFLVDGRGVPSQASIVQLVPGLVSKPTP